MWVSFLYQKASSTPQMPLHTFKELKLRPLMQRVKPAVNLAHCQLLLNPSVEQLSSQRQGAVFGPPQSCPLRKPGEGGIVGTLLQGAQLLLLCLSSSC